ncbi:MAG TPA: mechanosensitive ion channel domain-containing protein [Pseudolabrys sp.]|nr:mechanosensitive ion channel domain-containing protein [Pseudolabrys sp.]
MEDFHQLATGLSETLKSIGTELNSIWLLIQFGAVAMAGVIGLSTAAVLRRRIDLTSLTMGWPPFLRLFARLVLANVATIAFVIVIVVIHSLMLSMTWPSRSYLLGVASSLATAWVVIALVAGLIRNQFVYRVVAVVAWTIAALSILDLLQPTMVALDSFAIVLGGLRVTPLLVIKTVVLLMITLWVANAAGDFLEKRVHSSADLTPSIQVLIGKLIRLLLITFAILIVLSTVGIDFTALAFFSGAVGVGLGFGLQKIVSNLVSGIILLIDKSIKPGDVISVGEQFGWVTNMGARYTSIDTRDGREILVPNEDFVTQRVVNWSYSNYKMMLKASFGVSYDSDPHRVIEVAVAAAMKVPRVIDDPKPVCYFEEFGDSSLNFTLRYWIADPNNGMITVRAPVMLALWDAFKEAGIEIPYPVRDVRITQSVAPELSPVKARKPQMPREQASKPGD